MRHRIQGRKLGRKAAHRLALKRNLTRCLFLEFGKREYVITTREKAKFVQPFTERLITLAKEKTLANYRLGLRLLRDEDAVNKLFTEIGPRYVSRPGGYTRILRTPQRRLGDKASQVIFGFVRDSVASPEGAPTGASARS